jgi:hypothetical protein
MSPADENSRVWFYVVSELVSRISSPASLSASIINFAICFAFSGSIVRSGSLLQSQIAVAIIVLT